jgi:hypothetical protein
MARGTDLLKVVGLVGIGLIAVVAAPKVVKKVKGSKGKLAKVFDDGAQLVDHRIGWDKWDWLPLRESAIRCGETIFTTPRRRLRYR